MPTMFIAAKRAANKIAFRNIGIIRSPDSGPCAQSDTYDPIAHADGLLNFAVSQPCADIGECMMQLEPTWDSLLLWAALRAFATSANVMLAAPLIRAT